MKELILKIKTPKNYSFDEILKEQNNGGRFLVFSYLIPLPIFRPITRISKIYFLRKNEKTAKYSFKYNLLTMLWGWIGLPQGPSYTVSTVIGNRTGIDMSVDVFDNLTKEDYEKGYVKIKKINEIFIAPNKSELKELTKCFVKYAQNNSPFLGNPFIGKYIDTENPYFIIGLTNDDFIKNENLKIEIYKYFYKHIRFDFVNLSDASEIIDKLKSQGVKIIC